MEVEKEGRRNWNTGVGTSTTDSMLSLPSSAPPGHAPVPTPSNLPLWVQQQTTCVAANCCSALKTCMPPEAISQSQNSAVENPSAHCLGWGHCSASFGHKPQGSSPTTALLISNKSRLCRIAVTLLHRTGYYGIVCSELFRSS